MTTEKGHGRFEIRSIWTSTKLNDYLDFPHVAQVFAIKREITECKTGKTSCEIVSGITSLTKRKATPEQLLQYNRGQWSIEDRLHYVRDFTYDEDRSQVRRKNGPRMMACLRNFAISIFNLLGLKKIAQAVRYFILRPRKTLAVLGF